MATASVSRKSVAMSSGVAIICTVPSRCPAISRNCAGTQSRPTPLQSARKTPAQRASDALSEDSSLGSFCPSVSMIARARAPGRARNIVRPPGQLAARRRPRPTR